MNRWKGAILFLVLVLYGCGPRVPHTLIPDYGKTKTRLVAILPVDNKTNDQLAAQMLREKMLEKLYFKGYPKIPLKVIDAKLLKVYEGSLSKAGGTIPPKAVGELLDVDAVMYCTLSESETAIRFFYAPTSVTLSCELRSAKTGETLWQARYNVVERNFGVSRYDLEMKASQVYEEAIQEIVNEIIQTLPDGPDLSG
jgi:hypothetical protein